MKKKLGGGDVGLRRDFRVSCKGLKKRIWAWPFYPVVLPRVQTTEAYKPYCLRSVSNGA